MNNFNNSPNFYDLKEAVIYKDKNNIINLLKTVDINSKDDEGNTVLFFVNDYEIAKFLLSKYIDKNAINIEGNTALMSIIIKESENDYEPDQNIIDIIHLLIRSGATFNIPNEETGKTELMIAAFGRNYLIVKALLDERVNITTKNPLNGNTALSYACMRNNPDIIELLLNNRANINHQNLAGETPLMLSCMVKSYDNVELLLSRGAKVNEKDYGKQTALMFACFKDRPKIVALLLSNGANVNDKDMLGNTALITSCITYFSEDSIRLLVGAGSNVNEINFEQKTPLICLCSNMNNSLSKTEIAKLLILSGANVNHKDNVNTDAFTYACRNNNVSLIKLLIVSGVKIDYSSDCVKSRLPIINAYLDSEQFKTDYHEMEKYFNLINSRKSANLFSSMVLLSDDYLRLPNQ